MRGLHTMLLVGLSLLALGQLGLLWAGEWLGAAFGQGRAAGLVAPRRGLTDAAGRTV